MKKKERFQRQVRVKWKKLDIRISKDLRDVVHGYIMSDGFVRADGVLQIDQSSKQKLFVEWLYDKMEPIRTSTPIRRRFHVNSSTQSVGFSTRAVLYGFHNMWYRVDEKGNSKKKLPTTIGSFFNERFLSVWYAVDGTKTIGSKGAKFEVTAFTVEERLKLKALFLTKFNIETQIISSGISKKGRTQWALKIPAKEYSKFRELITKQDLIPKLFPHKLHKIA